MSTYVTARLQEMTLAETFCVQTLKLAMVQLQEAELSSMN